MQNESLANYYARRANEYEEIYSRDNPQRQKEQLEIGSRMKEALSGLDVLEVACGTGYWTQFASETAKTIMATDVNPEVLEIARHKNYVCPVSFKQADAYHLPFEEETFTGGLANFWFSHIPKNQVDHFLRGFHKLLKPGSPVFICDNMHVAGIGGDLLRKEGDENTYKLRTLKDGTQYEIVKNYFTKDELYNTFRKFSATLSKDDIFMGACFWSLKYQV